MMVLSIDPGSGRMALISLPRDTVNVPLPRTPEFSKARAVFGTAYAGRINSLYITARLRDDLFPGNDRQRGYRALMGALSELYGLDIKEVDGRFLVMEINDNPNIDAGFEDAVLKEEVYLAVMRTFLERLERRGRGKGGA